MKGYIVSYSYRDSEFGWANLTDHLVFLSIDKAYERAKEIETDIKRDWLKSQFKSNITEVEIINE